MALLETLLCLIVVAPSATNAVGVHNPKADSRAVNKKPHSLAQYGFHQSWKLPNHPPNEESTRRSIALRLLLAFEKSTPAGPPSKL